MSELSWYSDGTCSATTGSTVVTFVGADMIENARRGQMIVIPDGQNRLVFEITNITDANTITISPAYNGSTGTGKDYQIVPVRGRVNELLDAASNIISAIQGYIDGPIAGRWPDGTIAAPAFAFAAQTNMGWRRKSSTSMAAVIAGTDRFEVTSTGAIVNGAITGTAVVQSATDTTEGRLLTPGSFGWGTTGFAPNYEDWTRIDAHSGVYLFSVNTANFTDNAPPGWISENFGTIIVHRYNNERFKLTAWRNAAGSESVIWSRDYAAGVWSDWYVSGGNAVGTVSQVGGVQTGADMEHGEFSGVASDGTTAVTGRWTRFADGTQICWVFISPPFTVAGNLLGPMPAVFASTPAAGAPTIRSGSTNARDNLQSINSWGSASGTQWFIGRNGTGPGGTGAEIAITMMFVGRWF